MNVFFDDSLHGKVYIGLRGNQFLGAIVTSANFTGNGLVRNHEWGVYIDDPFEVENVYNQVVNDAQRSIEKKDLERMKRWFDSHPVKPSRGANTDLNVLDLVSPSPARKNGTVTYWLKPYGTVDAHVDKAIRFSEDKFNMTFAKGVKNIKEGDVLVVYAVSSRRIISVYVSTGVNGKLTTFNNPRDQRWPYYVVCKNLTPAYGAQWPQESLTLDNLRESYLALNPTKEVRPGSQDFHVLQWGMDRIKLDREFAKYVIDKVLKCQ